MWLSTVEFRLDVADLAETAFGFSALGECVLSLRAWKFPGSHPEHIAGLRRMRREFEALDVAALGALITRSRHIPDFLTPVPPPSLPEPAESFAALRATPPDTVAAHIRTAYGDEDIPAALAGPPAAVLRRVADALEEYWDRCLAPWWPQMRGLLEADLAYRGHTMLAGAQALFADLDTSVSWESGRLLVRLGAVGYDQVAAVDGRGLVLSPSLFVRRTLPMLDAADIPLVIYPARGRGTLWERGGDAFGDALENLIGRPRARLLRMLEEPGTTTGLARRMGVTPSAVSHHLAALHAAGLLERSRNGRSVLYFRSPLGDSLAG